uniref:SFRICE_007293 n=1 Tax=Spodoptera frugiperda TaxID=7108 RepID=A0A2H1W3P7_SPOFR
MFFDASMNLSSSNRDLAGVTPLDVQYLTATAEVHSATGRVMPLYNVQPLFTIYVVSPMQYMGYCHILGTIPDSVLNAPETDNVNCKRVSPEILLTVRQGTPDVAGDTIHVA